MFNVSTSAWNCWSCGLYIYIVYIMTGIVDSTFRWIGGETCPQPCFKYVYNWIKGLSCVNSLVQRSFLIFSISIGEYCWAGFMIIIFKLFKHNPFIHFTKCVWFMNNLKIYTYSGSLFFQLHENVYLHKRYNNKV